MTDYPFTDEDRARLEAMAGRLHRYTGKQDADADAIDSALAHITHLEGALESVCNVGDRAAVQVARAALPTSKED